MILIQDDPTGRSRNTRLRRSSIAGGGTFAERRQLPSRSSKENNLNSIKRRTIMKPSRHNSSLNKDFASLKPAEIKKIYLNKKLTKFRPASLETIFEEPTSAGGNADDDDDAESGQVRFIGTRKLRRVLTCSDGFVFNKALIKKRRAKIKKTFGRRLSLKKISLEEFLEKLNNSMEEQDEEGEKKKGNSTPPQGKITETMEDISDENIETEMDAMPIPTTTTIPTPLTTLPTTATITNSVNACSTNLMAHHSITSPTFLQTTQFLP
ncbi:protein tantalus [Musca vetustissima]|uniref:protein tantalus n=1 Tax=Musca vetustissima TaxID=27455 RepID=UPI002AB72D91|nr:protein tantalus [Musca vetustissima]